MPWKERYTISDERTLLDSELNERLGEIVGRLADHQRELTTAA